MRSLALSAAATTCLLAGHASGQTFGNADFATGNLSSWLVANTANGVGAPGSVQLVDIDGPGPLGVSEAAAFAVGQAVFTSGVQEGVELTQVLALTAGTLYTFEFDCAAINTNTAANAQGGIFSLIVDGVIQASFAAGSTSATTPKYGHVTAPFTPAVSGNYTVGARITRPYTVPATITQYVDNFRPAGAGGPTGACCRLDGSCIITSSAACSTLNGIYRGDNSVCATANCPQPPTGACCVFSGACTVGTAAQCTAINGVYRGDGTTCAVACPTPPPVVYDNCGFTTGTTTLSGVAAPANSLWSEVARDETDPTTANTVAGFSCSGAFRLADDFVVPAGGINLAYVRVYVYTTGAVVPGVTAATLQITDGSPQGTPNVVFGDQTTNRLASTGFTDIYRTFNTVAAPTCGGVPTAAGTTRRQQVVYIAVNQFLPAGTYWLDFNVTGASFAPPATQSDAIGRQCNPNNSNGLQFNAGWVSADDLGQGCAPTTLAQDFPFALLGTPGAAPCYANCDGSTIPPILNVSDFICFQTKYAANDPYANCDNSTIPPILNVSDFICFQTKYSAGCS